MVNIPSISMMARRVELQLRDKRWGRHFKMCFISRFTFGIPDITSMKKWAYIFWKVLCNSRHLWVCTEVTGSIKFQQKKIEAALVFLLFLNLKIENIKTGWFGKRILILITTSPSQKYQPKASRWLSTVPYWLSVPDSRPIMSIRSDAHTAHIYLQINRFINLKESSCPNNHQQTRKHGIVFNVARSRFFMKILTGSMVSVWIFLNLLGSVSFPPDGLSSIWKIYDISESGWEVVIWKKAARVDRTATVDFIFGKYKR